MAIFVKTPGHSPIKTRLAAGIGKNRAEEFHLAASTAVSATVSHAAKSLGATGYFAIAESAGMHSPFWRTQQAIYQGEGNLGQRLHRIYSTLQATHGYTLLMGADSPQMEAADLLGASAWLSEEGEARFVIGPASDGGFWLLGGNRALPESVWTSVEYSRPDTGEKIKSLIQPFGHFLDVRKLDDVDEPADLQVLQKSMSLITNIIPEQVQLAKVLIELINPKKD